MYLDKIVSGVMDKKIDAVVGIKTGGAIIAKYVAQKLGVPYYYVKVSADMYKCDKRPSDSYRDAFHRYVLHGDQSYILCEPITADVRDKNMLVLDETVGTGRTLRFVRDYLLQDKGARRALLSAVSLYYPKSYYKDIGLNIDNVSEQFFVVWPWGFDN